MHRTLSSSYRGATLLIARTRTFRVVDMTWYGIVWHTWQMSHVTGSRRLVLCLPRYNQQRPLVYGSPDSKNASFFSQANPQTCVSFPFLSFLHSLFWSGVVAISILVTADPLERLQHDYGVTSYDLGSRHH